LLSQFIFVCGHLKEHAVI